GSARQSCKILVTHCVTAHGTSCGTVPRWCGLALFWPKVWLRLNGTAKASRIGCALCYHYLEDRSRQLRGACKAHRPRGHEDACTPSDTFDHSAPQPASALADACFIPTSARSTGDGAPH